MTKTTIIERLCSSAVLGIVRIEDKEALVRAVEALHCGGLECVEITMTCPGALCAIERVSRESNDVIMGAGTVLDGPTARQAILSGAEFLITPTVELDVIEMGRRYGVPVIAGAMTPTEILTAWEAGADMVKIFPASVLGAEYLKAVRGPLPQIPLVPTGGVTDQTAADFIHAGAAMVCAGGWLVDRSAVRDGRFEVLTERARSLVAAVSDAKRGVET